jgi:serine/threonine protein kinase/tetratricopeptide (TPR) repeat protein
VIGSILAHYKILDRLGSGGMGEVYLAEDTRLRRRLALKVLAPGLSSDPDLLRRFAREAEAVAALNHPNIVTIYSVEEIEGVRCLTMELVEGDTLSKRLAAGSLPERELLEIAIPLADCVAAAHAKGVIHRDLKPGNIMITREGRLKVLDFGLAKLVDGEGGTGENRHSVMATQAPLTSVNAILGTLEYMAPEQLQGTTTDPRSDIYAVGVILYEMAAGVRPFSGKGTADLISSVLRDEPTPVQSLRPDLSPDIARIVGRCLEKNPEKRLQSAKDLRNELQALASGIRPPGFSSSPSRPATSAPALALVPTARRRLPRWSAAAVIAAVAAIGVWLGWTQFHREPPPAPAAPLVSVPSLAVLPLANLTGDPEYFVDGMTDALISALGNISSLRVISRQSVMRYKGSKKTLPEIAHELGVEMVVEGSVLRAGQQVRITAKLMRANPEKQIWTSSYERDFRNLLSLQSDVALAIASEVRVKVTRGEKARLAGAKAVDPAVQEAYLKGRFFWNRRTGEGFQKAIQAFDEAIALDPGHAPSYAGLADTYGILGYTSPTPTETFAKAKAAAERALALDGDLAEAHATLGMVHLFGDWDWAGAEKEFKTAIARKPNYSTAHQWYWAFLEGMGRHREALDEILKAKQLDPLSAINSLDVAVHYSFSRDHDRAIAECRKTLELAPNFPAAEVWLWLAYDHKGMKEEALRHAVKAMRLNDQGAVADAVEAAYAKSGYETAIATAAEELTKLSKTRYVETNQIAWLWVAAGRKEEAIKWLQGAFDRRAAVLVWLNVAGEWDSLRGDPRFRELLRKMRFPAPRAQ